MSIAIMLVVNDDDDNNNTSIESWQEINNRIYPLNNINKIINK